MPLRRQILASLVALPVLMTPSFVLADEPVFYSSQQSAIGGFDPVSYFMADGPQKGRSGIAVMWKGAIWHFANEENRIRFEANPRAYAPQFGGYCAYAVSQGYTIGTDPLSWEIVNGHLYLIHSPAVAERWRADRAGFIAQAEANWPAVLGE
ncbi:YHS domain-containing (seleno)protein [Primorskyibacter sp. S87]|uniref:YHS domain-containing (seleno)protein n=1 Tax=Primorskyibacter sp. S87 TaxID=3415126 RepID=UPI003C799C2D